MSDAPHDLDATLEFVWNQLHQVNEDRTAPCRLAALATVGDGGDARMVVVRHANRSAFRVDIHSDTQADKVNHLRHAPRATLLFWLPELQFQIRLRAHFSVVSGPEVEPQWARLHPGAQQAYGGTPPPATPLNQPEDHETTPQRDRFAVLRGDVRAIETLALGRVHRRALFTRGDGGFDGGWIAP